MNIKDLFEKFSKAKEADPVNTAEMELVSWQEPGPYVNIKYAVQWKLTEGSVRIPEPAEKAVSEPGNFTAAGKHYTGVHQLCAEKTGECSFRDIYGRDVFAHKERFPCFDSYDYLNEDRYYRWFYIRENGKLCCVYYADQRKTLEVTEDVRFLKDDAWKAMQEVKW